MTRRQEYAIEMLKREAKRQLFFGGEEEYEFKKCEWTDYGAFVALLIETGRKGDEGTLAEVLCRERLHVLESAARLHTGKQERKQTRASRE